jgi:outer membrane protein assembly factor BamB
LWVDHLSGDQFDPIESSPAVDIVARTLYVQVDANRFFAINTSNGKIRWRGIRTILTPPLEGFTSNTSAPALAGGKVFVASTVDAEGKLTAFAAQGCGSPTCAPLWTASTHQPGNPASPAAAGGAVYIPGENGSVFSMIAYDAGTGTELWNTGVLPQGDFSAEGPSLENGVVYGGNANGAVYGFDAATGARVWFAPTGGAGGSTTPVVVNGMVYVGNGNAQQLVAFRLP